jgi:hypothetical protein
MCGGLSTSVSNQEVDPLKTLILGLSALVLTAPAPAKADEPRVVKRTLEQRAERQRLVIRTDLQVLRFFRKHRWMLARYNPYQAEATRQIRIHRAQLRWTTRELRETKRAIAARERPKRTARERRERRAQAARIAAASPTTAIRTVFGRYAGQALALAHCESSLSTWAQNGQYLGLFQMGSNERSLYGHGSSAQAQAIAAYRYFMASGRDWSPWSCKP